MALMKYYFDLMSQPSRTVYMLLKLNKVPFEACPVALRKGEHMTEEYKTNVHPFGLVPALNDNGFKLTESVAISKYIIGKCKLPDNWYPESDLQTRAKVDEYLNWHHLNIRLQASMVIQSKLFIPLMKGKPPIEEKVNRWKKGTVKALGSMESYFLKDRNYLAGDKLSLADLFGACEVMQLYACKDEELIGSAPHVQAWLERVKDETQPEFDEAHQIVFRTRGQFDKAMEMLKQSQS